MFVSFIAQVTVGLFVMKLQFISSCLHSSCFFLLFALQSANDADEGGAAAAGKAKWSMYGNISPSGYKDG